MPDEDTNNAEPPLREDGTEAAHVPPALQTASPPAPVENKSAPKKGKKAARKQKKARAAKRRDGRKVALRSAGVFVGLISVVFVGSQIRETWRQSQLTYLQTRSQDFLQQEFSSETMGCLYDWWTPRGHARTRQPSPRHALIGTPADTQCKLLRTDYAEYSRVMLYLEETLMYFVEEARVTCSNGVNYGRELEIWRQDVAWDSSGAFSFYILSRFGDPNLGYIDPPPGAAVTFTPQESVRRYLEQARLFDVTLTGLCRNAARFRASLAFATREEPWVTTICSEPAETFAREYPTDNIFDTDYCREVHYIQPTISRRVSSMFNWADSLGQYIPF